MDLLWAPWRAELFSSPKFPGCIFCELPRRPDRRPNLVLRTTRSAVVMLNRYPYASGHVMVAPRRHVSTLADLSARERAALADELFRTSEIVRAELHCEGMNLGMNVGAAAGAGIADHLHWHVVPRWVGDTNFMPTVAAARVMPQHLLDTWDRLSAPFGARAPRARRR